MRFIRTIAIILLGFPLITLAQEEQNKNTAPLNNAAEMEESSIELKKERSESGKTKDADKNWEAVFGTSSPNANAWLEHYKTTRYSSYSDNSKEPSAGKQQELDEIVAAMAMSAPDTYQYHMAEWMNSGYSTSGIDHLEKAHALDPNNVELYDDMAGSYEMRGNSASKKEFLRKLDRSGVYSSDMMEYNYNVLQSLEQNAILITNGEYDTYPLWIQQEIKNVRPDVVVLNLDLLKNENYRARMIREHGLTLTTMNTGVNAFAIRLARDNPSKPIYFGLTMRPYVLKTLKGSLYCTGLAMKYSPSAEQNMQTLASNWEERFKVGELKNGGSSTVDNKLNNNYLLPILTLHRWYTSNGNGKKANEMEELALEIAERGGRKKQVKNYLKK